MRGQENNSSLKQHHFLFSIPHKQNQLEFLALSIITLLGAGFRFLKIGKQPLWLDEAFSVWMSRHSIPDIIKLTIDIDQHPPLYHILLSIWNALGGYSEAWVRSLSAVFGILTIIVIFSLGKTLSGPRVGLLSALLLALSPFHIQYGQEARSYALLTLCASLSMLMTARLLLDDRARTQPIGQQFGEFLQRWKRRSTRDNSGDTISEEGDKRAQRGGLSFRQVETDLTWLGYMVFTALTLFVHNTAVMLPIGLNLFMFGLMLFRRFSPAGEGQMQAPSLRNWLLAHGGVFLLWSPWLPAFFLQSVAVSGDFWIQPPTYEVVTNALKTFLMAFLPNQIGWRWLIWAAYGCTFILAFIQYRRRAAQFLFLAALFLTPFLGELLVSLFRPIFYDRTLIGTTIPVYVLIAVGISQLRFKPYIATALIILLTLSLLSIDNYFRNYEKERWDLAAVYVGDQVQDGDMIVFNSGWTQIPFDYYFAQYNRKVIEVGAPQTMFENGELEPRMTEQDLPRLREILRGRTRVWLVYSHNWWTDPDSLIQKELRRELRLMETKNFNDMQIQLYAGP